MWYSIAAFTGVALVVATLSRRSRKPVQLVASPIIKNDSEISSAVQKLAQNDKKWRTQVSYADKLKYLKELRQNLYGLLDEVTAASDALRNLNGTVLQGSSGVTSVAGTAAYLDALIELYESLVKNNAPPKYVNKRKLKDVEVVQTAPRPNLWHQLTQPIKIELWSVPGKQLTQNSRPVNDEEPENGVCVVLNPGNFEAPSDILHKLFLESRVVISKSHPINASSWDIFAQKLFYPLVRDGYLALTSGGPEIGSKLLSDPHSSSWMMTGGCGTFDAIVWGSPKDRESNKQRNQRQITKKCHAELGAASPWIIVPGNWTPKEITTQVKFLLGAKTFNTGHICASPQTVIVQKGWKHAAKFVEEIQKQLNEFLPIKPYYYGAQDRLEALKKSCPSAQVYKSGVVFIPDVDADGGGGDYILKNELFASGLGVKFVGNANDDILEFLSKTTSVVNEKIFGSLSCTVIIDPATRKILGPKFDEFLYGLNWGTIGVNIWAAFMAVNPYGTWGAPPNRHLDTDIQSGVGKMGNTLLLQNVNKSLIESPWCDPIMSGLLTPPNPKSGAVGYAYSNFAVQQTVGSLLGFVKALFF